MVDPQEPSAADNNNTQQPGAASASASMSANPSNAPGAFLSSVDLDSLTNVQRDIVTSIRLLQEDILGKNLNGADVKRQFADMFSPAILFSPELLEVQAIHTRIRDFLDSNGANLTQRSSRRILMTLAHELYDDAEDRESAIQMAKDIIAQGRRPTQWCTITISGNASKSCRCKLILFRLRTTGK